MIWGIIIAIIHGGVMADILRLDNYILGDITVIRAEGEIDLHSVSDLRRLIEDFLRTGYSKLIIDLTGVTYLDSSGIGALLAFQRSLKKEGCCLGIVISPSRKSIFRLFEISRINTILNIYDSLEEAIDAISAMPAVNRFPIPEIDAP
jgi:anti-anti-sigma factor